MSQVDLTDFSLRISNDMNYGDHTNGEILEWGPEEDRKFCAGYIEFIVSLNGTRELYSWERELIEALDMKECEDCGGLFNSTDGRFYKYELGTWLCDGCHDERMEE